MADPTIKRGPSGEVPAMGYDPTTLHAHVPLQVVSVVQDTATGQWYGILNVNASFSASSLSINDPTTTTQKATVDAGGNLHVAASLFTTTLFTTTQTTVGSGNSGDLDVSKLHEISIDITTTAQAGTSPTIQFFWNRKGADGIYYPLWQSAVLTLASNKISTSIGAGMAYNQSLGLTGQLSWAVGGSATPTWTFTPNIYGK